MAFLTRIKFGGVMMADRLGPSMVWEKRWCRRVTSHSAWRRFDAGRHHATTRSPSASKPNEVALTQWGGSACLGTLVPW